MNYWLWDSSLSIGIDVIDNQHRRIVDYLNELDDAYQSKDREKVSEVLVGLVDYTISHFTFEESLMEKAGYPLSEAHKRVHESFASQVNKYKERHDRGEHVMRELMSELRIWLTNHIKRDDRDYAPYAEKVIKKGWVERLLNRVFG